MKYRIFISSVQRELAKERRAIADYIRKDAQGFDGPVVEGRIYFDSFVLDAKKAGVGKLIKK